jgi:hypothetical protein
MENEQATTVTGPAGPAPQPELSIADLQNLRTIVETASRRGAFAAAEMSAVGAVFDRLNNFLTAVLPKQEPAPQDSPQQ